MNTVLELMILPVNFTLQSLKYQCSNQKHWNSSKRRRRKNRFLRTHLRTSKMACRPLMMLRWPGTVLSATKPESKLNWRSANNASCWSSSCPSIVSRVQPCLDRTLICQRRFRFLVLTVCSLHSSHRSQERRCVTLSSLSRWRSSCDIAFSY